MIHAVGLAAVLPQVSEAVGLEARFGFDVAVIQNRLPGIAEDVLAVAANLGLADRELRRLLLGEHRGEPAVHLPDQVVAGSDIDVRGRISIRLEVLHRPGVVVQIDLVVLRVESIEADLLEILGP